MKIVIIEDEKDLAILLSEYLKKTFTSVDSRDIAIAHSLKDGIDLINVINPEWVILDNNLPDGRGVDVIQDIKGKYTKLIVMSALNGVESQAFSNGADFFLSKPLSLMNLSKILSQ